MTIAWAKIDDLALKYIEDIVERASNDGLLIDTITTHMMDLAATHLSCPLDLPAMLAANKGDFVHDFAGIRRHINRQTGQLEDCFLPRFALAQHQRAA